MPSNTDDIRKAIVSAYNRMYAAKNRERIAAKARERYQKNREAILAKRRGYINAWHKENPETIREHKRRYREKNREKLREDARKWVRDESSGYQDHKQRTIMKRRLDLEAMAGRPRPPVCDICGGPPDAAKGMHFDHCHQSGQFRGWLCRKCNLMLGNAEDDPSRLRKGAEYLERYREVTHSIEATD